MLRPLNPKHQLRDPAFEDVAQRDVDPNHRKEPEPLVTGWLRDVQFVETGSKDL